MILNKNKGDFEQVVNEIKLLGNLLKEEKKILKRIKRGFKKIKKSNDPAKKREFLTNAMVDFQSFIEGITRIQNESNWLLAKEGQMQQTEKSFEAAEMDLIKQCQNYLKQSKEYLNAGKKKARKKAIKNAERVLKQLEKLAKEEKKRTGTKPTESTEQLKKDIETHKK